MVCQVNENTSNWSKYRCVFLLVYFCLLIIMARAIIKANAMIVTDTRIKLRKIRQNNNGGKL